MNCVLCGSSFNQKIQVIQHYEKRHRIEIKSERLRFFSEAEFYDWKKSIEITMTCHFAKRNSHYYKSHSLITFTCHRSGNYVSKANARKSKLMGSKKVNGLCPAEIKLHVTKTGTLNVLFTETHIGHSIGTEEESSHIFYISKKDRCRITSKIRSDIPLSGKLNEASEVKNLDSDKLHPMNNENLQGNLFSRNFQINTNRFTFDDVEIENFVDRNSASILYYKIEGAYDPDFSFINEDDAVLIFMNAKQEDKLKKFGGDVIALDTTNGSNEQNLILQILLVVDEYQESYPVVFGLSNRNNESFTEMFLCYIKDKIGTLQPNILMTDMEESNYNNWIKVMGKPKKRVYCPWFVHEKWKKDLKMISSESKRVSTKAKLYDLAIETNISVFHEKLSCFICDKDGELAHFLSYFQSNYLNNVEYWAYCYRILNGIKTNLYVKSFSKYSKYRYTGGRSPVIKNMSTGIQIIEKYLKRKRIDLKRMKSSRKLAMKLSTLKQRHDVIEINKICNGNNVNAYVEKTEIPNEWQVGSFVSPNDRIIEIYLVKQVLPLKCDNCPLVCEKCDICFHQFQCTCDDSSIELNMCKHIHALGLFLKYDSEMKETVTEFIFAEPPSGNINELIVNENISKFDEVHESTPEKMEDESQENERREIEAIFRQLMQNANTVEDLHMIREGLKILTTNLDEYNEVYKTIL